ncbi:ribosome small subunit-dependent GTPase A [Elizabethkingia occulta]|jgi:ribosome biogenesis GTPase|uniref:Small ribosomal subunit biogenesis GTPase RsgA n=2 Tax=Elizabethkingia TaxID=308865 RepID=A0ABX3NDR1_9FLAO|nr:MULTISPECIES: ribosome small subunit-dependent GTPase A [Elizabethkingia]MDR2231017.1 ribosome small subunit-dependent GTPase A [Flavobacteriaceae bacterium]MCL1664788.1 ribosome small subunit-dependent GTPase A [Elizabethkingia ursingii]MCL1671996.1 ribosome small subunit-dependent GTPase A [Elizabethkingia ursingii]OPB94764.1 ribosome small subunit-dependent GTPase A [Elizabethkingia ursingii]OPB95241.1 ribosome small subunit-dependent GTPase A [Elizabethkingia occulta]
MRGIIIKSTGSWYQVLDQESGKIYEARIRGKFKLIKTRLTNPLAVGDFVEFSLEQDDIAWITKIEPRKNYLIRKAVNLSKEAHIIASNIDIGCILFTLKMPETSLGFLDRFLVCCEAYDIKPLILFNKADLLDQEELEYAEDIATVYQSIGYDSLFVSSVSELNMEGLREILKDKTSVFFGHSGSGKSTLVNALNPEVNLKTGDISDIHLKGKHTTTFAQMHFWPFGGQVIDTPGVREFAMIDVEKEEIQHYFPEIFSISENCKFNNCLHINEPKCAVLDALEHEEILESRYATYIKLMEEAEELNQ